MNDKIRLFGQMFLRPLRPILRRHDTSYGGWTAERAPKRRVTFQDIPDFPVEPPPWHPLERHDTSDGGRIAERA